MNTEIYIMDVLEAVVGSMKVQIYGAPVGNFHDINFNPGRGDQIITALESFDGTALGGQKYPLCAMVMPFTENHGNGYLELTIPRILFADITQTGTPDEPVLQKYTLSGKMKTVLRPCVTEFIKRLAWSTFTNQGDPDVYPFSLKEWPGQPLKQVSTNDFVDVVEIIDLKATIFNYIKICKQ